MTNPCRTFFRLLLCCLATAPAAAQGRPDNILIIVADDLGVDAVGAYGEAADPPPTPNLDRLASRGVLFRNAWANPVCSSTRACMQTGRYSLRTFVGHALPFGSAGSLRVTEITIPEVLDMGQSGYAHAAIGKWHLGDQRNGGPLSPNVAGWSHFAGMIAGGVHNYYDWQRTVNGVTSNSQNYATTQIVDDALAWIDAQSGPWVCYLSFNAPHTPFHAPPTGLHSQQLAGLDPAVTPVPFFKAMVEAMDNELGRLLNSLGGELNRTNVIFIGDNGTTSEVSRAPFTPAHAKGTPYEGGVNVPLIVSGPIVRQRGREVAHLVSAVDMFATVTDLAGADARSVIPPWVELDSVSFVPYLRSVGAGAQRQTVFAELFDGPDWSQVNTSGFATIRDQRMKLVRYYTSSGGSEELYDLATDPFETQNLLTGPLSPAAQSRYDLLSQAMVRLRSPAGSLTTYGAPTCQGSAGFPTIAGVGNPAIGSRYTIGLDGGPAGSPAVMLLGSSNAAWGALSLPFPLQSIGGGPGCFFLASGEVLISTVTDSSGSAALPVPVPGQASLVGSVLFHAWMVTDVAAPSSTLGITTSNAIAAAIGV